MCMRKEWPIEPEFYHVVLDALYHKLRKCATSEDEKSDHPHFKVIKDHFEKNGAIYEDERQDVVGVLKEFRGDVTPETIEKVISQMG